MYKLFAALMLLLLIGGQQASAQFLKKLKDQVNNTVNGKPSSGNSASALPADNVKPTHADLSKFNTKPFYVLQDGEKFSFYEACLLIQADQLSPQFMVVKDGKTYTVDANGQHVPVDPKTMSGCAQQNVTRPELLPLDKLEGDKSQNYSEDTTIYSVTSPALSNMIKHIDTAALRKAAASGDREAMMKQAQAMSNEMAKGRSASGSYKMHAFFRGKDYGEYDGFTNPVFDRGAKNFYVLAFNQKQDNNGKFVREAWLIGSNGAKTKIPGTGQVLATPDFSFVRVLMTDMGKDYTTVTQTLYDPKTGSSTSLPTGPNMTQNIDMKTGRVITTMISGQDNKVYIDSKLVKTLANDPGVRPSNVFSSVDGSKWAVWGVNGLYFSNGEVVDGVISSKLQTQNNQPVLNWIVLGSDNKTLALCSYVL